MDSKIVRLPRMLNRLGLPRQFAIVPDGEAGDAKRFPGGMDWGSHLYAKHFRGDRLIEDRYLGSGLVTHVGTLALANDFQWPMPSTAAATTIKLMNFHASGIGVTGAAATDFRLGSLAAPTTTTAVTGTQSIIQPASLGTTAQLYQSVATISYGSTLAITEWGLHSAAALTASTGTPFTAATATTATVTGTPLTASSTSIQGHTQLIVVPGTTTVWGLVFSNSTSVFTFRAATATTGGWYTQAAGAAGSTPGATEAYTILPVLWDRKQFAAINVVSGDSIQFTYQLTVQSGG
jgi:hypothetical protein